MHGNVVIVHNFDLVVTVEAIHDALDIDGLALVGVCGDHVAVIVGEDDGADIDGHAVHLTGEGHCAVGAVIVTLGGVDDVK